MPRTRKPKAGSMQYWPRKRSKKQYARVRSWADCPETKLLGFAGYKVGMTHAIIIDNRPKSLTKNEEINCPVTIIECPALKTLSVRFYKKTSDGLRAVSEVLSDKLDKELERKIIAVKKPKKKFDDIKEFYDLRLVVHTQPKLTTIGKKRPEIFEIAIGGKREDKLNFAKDKLGKEINVSEVLQQGQHVDVHSISKGKGLQGPIKRFGIGLRQHKSEKGVRRLGTLGGWKAQGHFMYRVAHAGQMGFHQRMEHNKLILKMGNKPDEINPKGGFKHYGIVKNDYILLKGSVIGHPKRMVKLNYAIRPNKKIPKEAPLITYIGTK